MTKKEQVHINGNKLTIADTSTIVEKLPVGVYSLKITPFDTFYLEKEENFKVSKMYGDNSFIDRMLTAINNTEKNLGIMFSGYKGTGKTESVKTLCIKSGLPVITINRSFSGDDFNTFLTSPAIGKCIILFDEFDKVYGSNFLGKEEREINSSGEKTGAGGTLLSLMDGLYPNAQLIFILTMNEWSVVDTHLLNRPSRIRYHKKFVSLTIDQVSEYCDETLMYPEYKEDIVQLSIFHGKMTWDILKTLVDEVNVMNESPYVLIEDMNINSEPGYYKISVIDSDGNSYECLPNDIVFNRYVNIYTTSMRSSEREYSHLFDCKFTINKAIPISKFHFDKDNNRFYFIEKNMDLGIKLNYEFEKDDEGEIIYDENCEYRRDCVISLTPSARLTNSFSDVKDFNKDLSEEKFK